VEVYPDNHSKGCKICQKGKWLCIYLTYQCNASCAFCPAPSRSRDIIRSAFGEDPVEILKYLDLHPFEGVSFSGGESFMVFDRMLKWLKLFKDKKPDLYYWAYTNGINIRKEQLDVLKSHGLNELRFNIAATAYKSREILDTICYASEIFQHVAVEIPSIPEDFEILCGILQELNAAGVEYLNLHEYILVPGDPNTKSAPAGQFVMNQEMQMQYHRNSLENTERIKEFCQNNGIGLLVNNCSLMKKEHQMKGRRLTMGSILKKDHERLSVDGFLETIYIPDNHDASLNKSLESYFLIDPSSLIHPDRFDHVSSPAYLLTLLPAMDIGTSPRIIQYRKIHEA